ncbi:MAG: nuclear transport factor 2 family protein [Chitinophagaceae bacterium]
MMQKIILLLILSITTQLASAQMADSNFIILRNQQIDTYVVEHNTTALDSLYADDFVFSHGSGRVEGKQNWFTSVAKGSFLSRLHDSVTVEFHPQLAIVRGKLSVQKKGKEKIDLYHLYYVRVYALRKNAWQMISHVTTREYHEL